MHPLGERRRCRAITFIIAPDLIGDIGRSARILYLLFPRPFERFIPNFINSLKWDSHRLLNITPGRYFITIKIIIIQSVDALRGWLPPYITESATISFPVCTILAATLHRYSCKPLLQPGKIAAFANPPINNHYSISGLK